MSVFDVLKYELSYPFKEKELKAIPAEVYNRYLVVLGMKSNTTHYQLIWYLNFFETHHHAFYQAKGKRLHAKLRQILLEYEE